MGWLIEIMYKLESKFNQEVEDNTLCLSISAINTLR